jgi:histidinol dehydrogenase
MKVYKYPSRREWAELVKRPEADLPDLFGAVREILDGVRAGGDEAVKRYGRKFDRADVSSLQVTEAELQEAGGQISGELKQAIRTAHEHIRTFHAAQRFDEIRVETAPGVTCLQKAVPIDRVGLYVPGGTAPLFSSVLMLAVPAVIAGCRQIVLCSPPDSEGKIHPAILFAARVAGVGCIYKAGGVQAIGAMAYGTATIPKVDKIFGPGNRYVTAAKQWVSLRDVAIDMPAGPSEVEIIADGTARPAFIAADFLSQAEHGADSQSILVTTEESLTVEVMQAIDEQLAELPRRDIASRALEHSKIIILKNREEVIDFTNRYAPEHLIIQTADYSAVAGEVRNAGSVFLGPFTPESAGDYASGTNHTLPTNGYAKAYSGVNLDSFMKKITFQEITSEGIRHLGETIRVMAAHESLDAHKHAVTIRLESL